MHDLSEGENNETSSATEEEEENSAGYAQVQVELQEYTKKCQNSDLSDKSDKLGMDPGDPSSLSLKKSSMAHESNRIRSISSKE